MVVQKIRKSGSICRGMPQLSHCQKRPYVLRLLRYVLISYPFYRFHPTPALSGPFIYTPSTGGSAWCGDHRVGSWPVALEPPSDTERQVPGAAAAQSTERGRLVCSRRERPRRHETAADLWSSGSADPSNCWAARQHWATLDESAQRSNCAAFQWSGGSARFSGPVV